MHESKAKTLGGLAGHNVRENTRITLSPGDPLCYHSGTYLLPCRFVDVTIAEENRVEAIRAHINVLVFPPFKRRVTARRIRQVVEATLAVGASNIPSKITDAKRQEVSLVIADDTSLLELNRTYRGLNEVTDVLSFSPYYAGHYEGKEPPISGNLGFEFPESPDDAGDLGEVVLSYPQAKRQALQAKHSVALEVDTLVAHGILHLLGYDHMEPEEEREMFTLQDKALAIIQRESVR